MYEPENREEEPEPINWEEYNSYQTDNGAYDFIADSDRWGRVTNDELSDITDTFGGDFWDLPEEEKAEYWDAVSVDQPDDPGDNWNAQEIDRYASAVTADPEIEIPGVDANVLTSARAQLIADNPGKSPEEWAMTPAAKALTATTPTAPVEVRPDYEKSKATWSAVDQQMSDKGFKVYNAADVPQTVRDQYVNEQPAQTLGTEKYYLPINVNAETGIEQTMQAGQYEPTELTAQDEFSKLTPVQQTLSLAFAHLGDAMAAMAGVGTARTVTGMTGNPVIGIATGLAAGGLAKLATETDENGKPKNELLYNAYQVFNYLADNFERVLGYGEQVLAAGIAGGGNELGIEIKKGQNIGEIPGAPYLGGAAMEASKVAFESQFSIYDKDNNLVTRDLTSPELKKTYFEHAMGGIPISDQQAEALLLNPEMGEKGKGYLDVVKNRQENPMTYEKGYRIVPFDANLIISARKRILAGEGTDAVYNDIVKAKGFPGMAQDLMGNVVLDPLNIAPEVATKGVGKVAELTGHGTLAEAASRAKGPVETLRAYGNIARSELDATQRANLNPVAKWASGLDKLGNMREYEAPGAKQNPFNYLFGLDRKSRATQVLYNSLDGITNAISMIDPADPAYRDKVRGIFAQISGMTPKDTVEGLSQTTLPRWFDSAEAQHIPASVKDMMPAIEDLYSKWGLFEGDRNILKKTAEGLGVDPYKLAAELHNSTDGKAADARYRQFIDEVATRAANEAGIDPAQFQNTLKNTDIADLPNIIPDGNAGTLLKALLSDDGLNNFTGSNLKVLADKFIGENAPGMGLDNSMFTARMLQTAETGIGKWSAKYFGVKPSNKFMRMSVLAKRGQSMMVLGMNPSNWINNTLNNWATIGADMGIGTLLGADPQRFYDEYGIRSSREGGLYEGEAGSKDNATAEIAKAARGDDFIQSATDVVTRAGRSKLAPFAILSRKAERAARDIAFTTSAREFIDAHWTAGKGFEKMPADLRMVLDTLKPGLADSVERAISHGKKVSDIRKQVYGNLGTTTLRDTLTATEYTDMRKLNPDAFNEYEKAINEGKPVLQAEAAYHDSIVKQIKDEQARYVADRATKDALTVSSTGIKGLSDSLMGMYEDYADFHHGHMDYMAETAKRAEAAPDAESRSAIWREAFRQSDDYWNLYNSKYDVNYLSYLKGMGAPDEAITSMLKLVDDQRLNQRAFFNSRKDAYDTHSLTEFATDAERRADLERIQTQLNQEYIDMVSEESRLQSAMDDITIQNYVDRVIGGVEDPLRRGNLNAEVTLWLGKRHEVRRKMMEAELLFRTGALPDEIKAQFGDLLTPEVKKAIEQYRATGDKETYYREVYQRGISEMLETANKYAPGREPVTEANVSEAQPYIELASLEKQRSELRKIAHDVANVNNDKHLVNIVRKYAGVEINSMNDITPDILLTALKNREAEKLSPIVSPARDAFMAGIKQQMNLSDEQLKARMVIADATAKLFAEEQGITPAEIYERFRFGDVEGGLFQGKRISDMTKDEIRNWEFPVPEGSSSVTPKTVFSWIDGEFETLHDLSTYSDKFRFEESLGKGWERENRNTLNLRKAIINDEPITIYRATDTSDEIIPGAYVSESLEYVQKHQANIMHGEGKILSIKAKPSELVTYGDPHEFIYKPDLDDYFKRVQAGELYQTGKKGSVEFTPEGKAVVSGSPTADISTALHEPGHVYLRIAPDVDKATVTNWLRDAYGKDLPADWMMQDYTTNADFRDAHEKFARAYERYHTEGIAPKGASSALIRVFNQIREWMTQIYREIQGSQIDVQIDPNLRHMLDEWSMGRRLEADQVTSVMSKAEDMVTPEMPAWTKPENPIINDGTTASVPVMITRAMKENLRKMGVTDEEIRNMTPTQAWEKLNSKTAEPESIPEPTKEVKAQVQQAKAEAKRQLFQGAENTPEFNAWFGDSKVVDEQGKPLVSTSNRGTFDPNNPNILFQTPEWTPETLNNYVNFLLAKNDKQLLLEAVRDEPIRNRRKLLDMVGKQNPDLASPVWYAMDRAGELDSNTVSGSTRALLQEMQPGERLPEDAVPIGTVDGIFPMPKADGLLETYMNHVKPLMGKIRSGMESGYQASPTTLQGVNLPDKARAGIDAYVRKVEKQRADVNMAALRHGEGTADFAMLNYNRQTQADNLLNVVMPYQFWYTRSMANWAIRAIDKPVVYANQLRLLNFSNSQQRDDKGFPTRLKGKMGIRIPFTPDWMGDAYFDPMKQIYPILNMTRPYQELLTDANRENKKAATLLQNMVDNGELTQQDADNAISTMQGDNWNKALAQARNELDTDTSDPLQFAQTISGFSLPVSLLVNSMTGRQDKIGMLPITRYIKNFTAWAGMNNYKGLDLSIPGLGGDPYQDNRINTMLANMAANGEITADAAKQAMATQSGEAYILASKKVAILGGLKSLAPGMGLDFYPEGEQKVRETDVKYKEEAIPAFEKGDTKAKSAFFDQYPALSARYQSYEDPEKMLNSYLVGEVWDAWGNMPDVYKTQAKEQLGNIFTDWLNPETRAEMPDAVLAGWANAMGKIQPKEIDAVSTPIRFADKTTAAAVQKFNDTRKKLFPKYYEEISKFSNVDYNDPSYVAFRNTKTFQTQQAWSDAYKANHPEIIPWTTNEQSEFYGVDPKIAKKVYAYRADKYGKFGNEYNKTVQSWTNKYLAKNPEIIPYVIGESNDLQGVKPEIQAYVYRYRTERDARFPGITENWDNIPWSTRNQYLAWQKQVAGAYPEASPYIVSDNTIRKGLGQPTVEYSPIRVEDMSNELRGQYYDLLYSGQPLTTGANMELRRLWEAAGSPEGDFTSYIKKIGGK
jgi:hypothetical protein